jgi:hypothetical protein
MAKTLPFESPEPDVVIAVYDAKTGAVRHVHQEIWLPGSAPPAAEQSIQRAIAFAQDMSEQRGVHLAALSVPSQDRAMVLRSRVPLKVDLKKRTIVSSVTRRAKRPATRRARA